ncbi:MAG: hypothetical protein KatS3mg096_210 [Candidatus Parcubacteria bacterium]|nr:MAG: hypothetical protein KatS3mg096_210 [Candidatus Parcubacteria bacterium]
MLGGIHFFLGSALSSALTQHIFIAFLIGFVSHHLSDYLPHLDLNIFFKNYQTIKDWDVKIWLLVVIEFIIFVLFTFYFIGKLDFNLQKIAVIGGLGAIFPDIFTLGIKTLLPNLKIFNFYFNFHKNFHFKLKNKNYLLPIIIEILLIIFGVILFLGNF